MKRTVISFCIALMLLGGCGVKPSFVDPPQGHANDKFPQTYPNTATDPK
jgi:uncharacterized protein YceK